MTTRKERTTNALRSKVRALQRATRDQQGNSNLIERFDEITKIAYCKAHEELEPDRHANDSVFLLRPRDNDETVAQRIRERFLRLAQERPDLFPQRFGHLNASAPTIRKLAEITATLNVTGTGQDVNGTLYEEIIRNTFDKGDNQQFFTPRQIVEFMVEAIAPRLSGRICDPACGTGGFLLYTARRSCPALPNQPSELLGFEIDERLAWVTGMNLSTNPHNMRFQVQHLNGAGTLGKEMEKYAGTIDAIITNPPFGSDLSDQEALSQLVLGNGKSSRRRGTLFIERCLDLLRPGGVVAIIIDDGALAGASNKDARSLILDQSLPLAIISLPETAFMPYASVKASILILEKRTTQPSLHDHAIQTFFAEARTVGRKPNGEPLTKVDGRTPDTDLPAILAAWQAGPNAQTAADEEKPPHFWTSIQDTDPSRFDRDGTRLDLAYHDPTRRDGEQALMSSPYALTPLRDLCKSRKDTMTPCQDAPDEQIAYVGLSQIKAGTGQYQAKLVNGDSLKSTVHRYEPGDILYSKMRPALRKVCLADDRYEEAWTSTECLILSPRKNPDTGDHIIHPELLVAILRSDLAQWQTAHLVAGIGRPRISEAAVMSMLIPTPPPEEQQRMLETLRKAQRNAAELTAQAEIAAQKAKSIHRAAGHEIIRATIYGNTT